MTAGGDGSVNFWLVRKKSREKEKVKDSQLARKTGRHGERESDRTNICLPSSLFLSK